MFQEVSQADQKARDERVRFLYSDGYVPDAITACLMDTSKGGIGLDEGVARAKAHSILDWLLFVKRTAPLNPDSFHGYEELWGAERERKESK